MRLLICTQTVDKIDPALGFFHHWIEELAPKCEHITVVCLKQGTHTLPSNVEVVSLGKEEGTSRITKLLRFFRYIISRRSQYDTVLVHMNQEYVLMGGLFWKLMGKKIFLWRNHYKGSVFTNIAVGLCDKVFYTSRFSYTAKFRNAVRMPVGVDIESAHPEISVERLPRSILFLARLDESKRADLLLEALGMLSKQGTAFMATIVGAPTDPHSNYPERLRAQAQEAGIEAQVTFAGAVANTETFRYYRSHDIFVNCSRSGMLDKTMFKAVACGCLVISASRDLAEIINDERFTFPEDDARALADRIAGLLALGEDERAQASDMLKKKVLAEHGLPVLVEKLITEMEIKLPTQA